MDITELTRSEIDDLVARYPLPAGAEDVVLNREELADQMNVSLPTITDWIRQGMPVQQTGGQGKAYELRLAHCWAWDQARRANEALMSQEKRRKIEANRLALVGGSTGDTEAALNPKDRREIYAAQIEGERLAAQRRQLLPRADVRDMIEQLFVLIRDTMESAPDRIERETAIPAEAIDAFVDICDGVTAEAERRIRRFWQINAEDRTPERRDLFDAN